MQLMYAPGTCAIGIHIVLEEIGKPYELVKVDFANRAQYGAEFTARNPKSKVPVLVRDDGSVLTEYQAISVWLGLTNPQAKLIPPDAEGHARMLECMDYVVGTMHGQAWRGAMRMVQITPEEAAARVRPHVRPGRYLELVRSSHLWLLAPTWIAVNASIAYVLMTDGRRRFAVLGAVGCVVREHVTEPSNFRARGRFEDWLKAKGKIGLSGVDTRALTRLLRSGGVLRGVIGTGRVDTDALIQKARALPRMEGADLVQDVTCQTPFDYQPPAEDLFAARPSKWLAGTTCSTA